MNLNMEICARIIHPFDVKVENENCKTFLLE